jgi:hypothetical protein
MKRVLTVAGVLGVMAIACAAYAQTTGGHKAPEAGQPHVAAAPAVPTGELALGTARIPRAVMADGKPLPAGTYQVRLTAQASSPEVVGQTPSYERWVEFVQRGEVKGREVVSIVPGEEIATVAQDPMPRTNGVKVELLVGGDYYRVWINKGGAHYLVYLPPSAAM